MNEKTKLILTVVLGVLVSGGFATGIYLGNAKIDEAETKTSGLEKKIAEYDGKLREVPELRRQVEHLSEVVVRYERILPNERELVNIVNFFNDARRGAGIDSLSSSPVTKKPRGRNVRPLPYEKHSFEIEFSCTFEEFARFVNLLETQPRFMQVEAFSLKANRKKGMAFDANMTPSRMQVPLEAEVTISTYRFNPNSGAANRRSRRASRRNRS